MTPRTKDRLVNVAATLVVTLSYWMLAELGSRFIGMGTPDRWFTIMIAVLFIYNVDRWEKKKLP